MSVRYTSTWYDVMHARQHHTHQSSTVSYSSPPPPPVCVWCVSYCRRNFFENFLQPLFCQFLVKSAKIRPQFFFSAAPFELFGWNFCHLATLLRIYSLPAGPVRQIAVTAGTVTAGQLDSQCSVYAGLKESK